MDSTGAVVFAGRFRQQIDIKGTILRAAGESFYLSRLQPNGTLDWAIALGPVSIYTAEPTSAPVLAIDTDDHIYFTGRFDARDSRVDCGDGVDRARLGTGAFYNGSRILVARFKPDKTCVWARTIDGGPSVTNYVSAMGLTSTHDLIIAGAMNTAFKIDSTDLSFSGENDLFLARLRANTGTEIWARRYGNTGDDRLLALAVTKADEILLTGYITGGVDLGKGALQSFGKKDGFLARYDGSGAPQWTYSFGSGGDDLGTGVAVDAAGAIALAATAEARIDFDPQQPGRVSTRPLGLRDAVVAAFEAQGRASWALSLGGSGDDSAVRVAMDGRGSVLLAGNFTGQATFGSSSAMAQQQDGFLTRHSLFDGQVLQIVTLGGAANESITGLTVDRRGAAYVVGGTRSDAVDFGGGALNTYGAGSEDLFVVKLASK